jgi:hypothetical protein
MSPVPKLFLLLTLLRLALLVSKCLCSHVFESSTLRRLGVHALWFVRVAIRKDCNFFSWFSAVLDIKSSTRGLS